MISLTGNKNIIHDAELIERSARTVYNHVSASKLKTVLDIDKNAPEYIKSIGQEVGLTREMFRQGGDFYSSLIFRLQEKGIGNCTEDAIFAQLLGMLNGQKNIYAGGIYINKNNRQIGILNHAVAFITNKDIENKKEYFFKNREAVIIDPWLNITDFAGSYFNKIKTIFRKYFKNLSNDNIVMELIRSEAHNPREFKQIKKECCPHTSLSIIPFIDKQAFNQAGQELKEFFPELIIKKFKPVILENKKNSKNVQ